MFRVDIPYSPHLWRSNIGNTSSKRFDGKDIPVLSTKTRSCPASKRIKVLHVHDAFEECVGTLPEFNS